MAYETPIQLAQMEVLGRIADALEGIRFSLATNLATITSENNALRSSNKALNDTIQRIQAPGTDKEPLKLVEPYKWPGHSVPLDVHPRRVLSETENGIETQPTSQEHKNRIEYFESEAQHINEPDHNS